MLVIGLSMSWTDILLSLPYSLQCCLGIVLRQVLVQRTRNVLSLKTPHLRSGSVSVPRDSLWMPMATAETLTNAMKCRTPLISVNRMPCASIIPDSMSVSAVPDTLDSMERIAQRFVSLFIRFIIKLWFKSENERNDAAFHFSNTLLEHITFHFAFFFTWLSLSNLIHSLFIIHSFKFREDLISTSSVLSILIKIMTSTTSFSYLDLSDV